MGYWGTGVWSGDAPCDETSSFINSIVPIYTEHSVYNVQTRNYTSTHLETVADRCLREETIGGAMAVLAAAQALGLDTTGMGDLVKRVTTFEREMIPIWLPESQKERKDVITKWRRKILGKASPYRIKDLPELELAQRDILKKLFPESPTPTTKTH